MLAVVRGLDEGDLKGFRCEPIRLTRDVKRLRATVNRMRKRARYRSARKGRRFLWTASVAKGFREFLERDETNQM